jgi:hypothetical protein
MAELVFILPLSKWSELNAACVLLGHEAPADLKDVALELAIAAGKAYAFAIDGNDPKHDQVLVIKTLLRRLVNAVAPRAGEGELKDLLRRAVAAIRAAESSLHG